MRDNNSILRGINLDAREKITGSTTNADARSVFFVANFLVKTVVVKITCFVFLQDPSRYRRSKSVFFFLYYLATICRAGLRHRPTRPWPRAPRF